MPLSSKEKTARHRQRVNADPEAREEYLARRREIFYFKSDVQAVIAEPEPATSRCSKYLGLKVPLRH